MSDLIVSQDVDNFMQSVNATTALASISGLSISGGTVKGNISVSGVAVLSSVSIANGAVIANSAGIYIQGGNLSFGGYGGIGGVAANIYPDRLATTTLQVTDSLYVNKYYENLTPLSAKYAPINTYNTLNTLSGNVYVNATGYTQGSVVFEDASEALIPVELYNLGVSGNPTFRNVNVNTLTANTVNITNTLTATSINTNILTANSVNTNTLTATTANVSTLTANSVNINTLTAVTVTITTLTSVNANINSLTAREIISDVNIGNITTTKTFSYSADNSKIFNFNTTSGSISIFPGTLPNGFNVGITNIGTNTVYISSTQVNNLCATSNKNSTQFSGIYIYKTNNSLYGIGRFS